MILRMLFGAIVLMLMYCPLYGQNSPFPTIVNYGGTSLDSAYSPIDTTFCKGAMFTIQGMDFISVGGGDNFDSFVVRLDTFPCQILQLNATPSGNNDDVTILLPDLFVADTCLPLHLIKFTSNAFGMVPYLASDTICLTGDYVDIQYADSTFCLGDTNPRPATFVSTDSLGSFCCTSGSPGFIVLPNGEIPLHNGAVGLNQSFAYETTHPECSVRDSFQIDVLARIPAQATFSSLTSASYCPSGYVLADTTALFPKGGRFHSPDTGLVMVDDSIGLIDLGVSNIGVYDLYYFVDEPCYDSAHLVIEVLPLDSALVTYPISYQGNFQRVCQNSPLVAPLFLSGSSGGTFTPLPNTLVLDSNGVIDPILSQPGNYTIMYVSPGTCPDTVIAAANLTIDSIPDASFVILPNEVCERDSILPIDSVANPGIFEVFSQGVSIYSTTLPGIPVQGVLSPGASYLIRHIQSGNGYCSDTAYDFISVVQADDASFAYDPDFYCFGDNDPIPLIMGNGGGSFQPLTVGTVVDSIGRLDLNGSGPGMHIIQYLTSGVCPDSMIDTVQINNSVNAFFSYPASQYCKTDSNPLPQVTSGGGSFAGNMVGIVIDSVSGEINLGASDPGLYEVTYSFIGSCQTSYTLTLQISDFPNIPSLAYPSDTFCRDSSPPFPSLNTDSLGVFIGSAGVVFQNSVLGSVDLSLTPSGGPYVVQFDIGNPCAIDPADTFYVLQEPFLDFTYPVDAVCIGNDVVYPDIQITPSSVGIDSFSASGGLSLGANGEIGPSLSQPGSYQVVCRSEGYCPATEAAAITIHPLPLNPEMRLEPDTVICSGDPVEAMLSANDGVSFSYLLNGEMIDSLFFFTELDSLRNGDLLTGLIGNAFGCLDSIEQQVTVRPRPTLTIDPPSGSVLRKGGIPLRMDSDVPFTIVDWSISYQSNVLDSGISASIGPGNSKVLDFDLDALGLDPAKYLIELKPSSLECPGEVRQLEYYVLEQPFFVPEVFTPNGDGQNDIWQVVWLDQVSPVDYSIRVFNRSGGEVHRMSAFDQWDGGALPDGVYWWLISGPEGSELQRGGLTLRRR